MTKNTTALSAPEEAFQTSSCLVAEALGKRIAECFDSSSLGVLVESPPEFDPEWFVKALDRSSTLSIGLTMVNIDEADIRAVQEVTEGTSVRASNDLATAIEWRNENETGFEWGGDHAPDRIVVLVRGDPARLNSLHRLYDLPLGEVRKQIASLMASRPEFSDNPSVQELWRILGEGRTANLSISAVAEYSVHTIAPSQQASIEALGEKLYYLGLFPDANILTEEIKARLEENDDAVSRVRHLTNRDRRRLMNSIQQEQTEENQAEFVELLRRYQRTHDDSLLSELEFERVKKTLETTSRSVARRDGNGSGTDGSSSGGSGSKRGRRYERRHDDSAVGVELSFSGEEDEIQEIATELDNELPGLIDEEEEQAEIVFAENSKVVIDIDSDTYHFIQRFVDDDVLGGLIEEVEDRYEALENIGSLPVTKFQPDGDKSSITKLRAFAERNKEFESVVDAIDEYLRTRAKLVDALPQIFHSPLLAFLGDKELLEDTKAYLNAYQDAQNQLDTHYRTLQDASVSGAVQLLSEFLLFDMIVIEMESSREMILSPLHPLHLWKYVRLATEVSEQRDTLTEGERQFLEESVDEQPHVLNNLSIGGGRHLDEEVYLIQSDELNRLPVYTEADRAEPGTNSELWEYLIEKFSSAYPPSESNFKLTVVDPLDPSGLLHIISTAAQRGLIEGVNLDFCYINSDRQDILSGATSAEEEDILTVFGPRSDFDGFTVQTRKARSFEEFADALEGRPQHCVVINDNGTFQIEEFERDPNTAIHPLYVPKEFDYDGFENKIQIRASAEGELFSEFQDLVNQLFNTRTTLHRSNVHDLEITEDIVQQFLGASIWTVISTPATNIDPFWENDLISKERRGDRNYGIYSKDFELFTRTLNRLLREYPIATEEIKTARLAERIAELQNSGLLRLITEETLGQEQSKNTQGLLGSVIALQWLEEEFEGPKLVFSIDDPRTRRWLNFGDANRRADFVVAQLNDGVGIDLTIVEVKTLSEPDNAFEVDKSTEPPTASGDAVDQVIETASTIRSLFDGDDNITKQPRREALREQLYYELVGTEMGSAKAAWADQINSVFRGDAELHVHPSVISVELNNPAGSEVQHECTTDKAQTVSVNRLPRRTVIRMVMNGNDADSKAVEKTKFDRQDRGKSSNGKRHTEEGGQSSSSKEDIPDEEEAVGGVNRARSKPPEDKQSTDQSFGEHEEYAEMTEDLKRILSEFGISVRDVPESEIDIGPNVIRYKVELSPGEEQSQLQRRSEDIAREMALDHEPIIHRLSGTSYIAIDIPRTDREVVEFYDYIDTLPDSSEIGIGELPYIAGIEPAGTVKTANLQDAPHMLVGGATGSGKTVFLRSLLASILERQSVENIELAIVDPKQTDFVFCNPLPNLKTGEVITDSDDAYELFNWIVETEIPRRTDVLTESASIDIRDHNKRTNEPMSPLVVIIDEYADLLDSLGERSDEFETQVRRIAQRARNVGIHLVIATQRPSAQIIDTDLRANLNVRVAFRVPSGSDSQVILDETGAEGLAGQGDMLFKEADKTMRLQGTLIGPNNLRDLVNELR